METVDLDKIKQKLQKLMRLFEGAKKINSEGEANAAAAAIQRLLTQYNLTASDIRKDGQEDDAIKENILSFYRFKSIGGSWEYKLMDVICHFNFCRVFIYGKSKDKNMIFFGKEENMQTVKWLHNMLCERFVSFGKNRYKQYTKTSEYAARPIGLDTYLRRYLEGCASGLYAKLREEREAAKRESEDKNYGTKVTALAVQNGSLINAYIDNKFGGRGGKTQMRNADRDSCFAYGFKDGRETSINKEVGDSVDAKVRRTQLLK